MYKFINAKDVRYFADSSRDVIFINGCFDLFHVGHLDVINFAADRVSDNSVLVVGINTNDSVRALKGNSRPLVNFEDRVEIVASLEVVDFVVAIDSLDASEEILNCCPDYYVTTRKPTQINVHEREALKACGADIRVCPIVRTGISTTNLIEKIKANGLSSTL